ncbi:hypothetical protein EKO04_010619 [Ascochyta lentis]|uniref:NAD(P)-binding protein n=1 Tax=Ascochyta lentis TaxID=205686 RepID=A0A8H7ME14_9PLEO|nr:hypothetical protein EKO04_010619 [Ascochyta lentis]
MEPISFGLDLEGSHVLVTGGAGLIGRVVVDHFLAAGAKVSSVDISRPSTQPSSAQSQAAHPELLTIHCDVSDENQVQQAFTTAVDAYGPVDIAIALASLDLSVLEHSPFADASFDQLRKVLDINVAGTWLTAREWIRGLRQAKHTGTPMKHPNLIIIGSESGLFGERQNAEYSLGKSAVQGGLLHSLRMEIPREWPGARVNVVAPGPVRTDRWEQECTHNPDQYYLDAQATTALGGPVPVRAVAMTILSIASHNFSSHIHGQIIAVDGGKQGKLVWTQAEAPQPYPHG